MIVRQALAEAYEYCIGFNGRYFPEDVVDRALHEHPELFLQESARLIRQQALREAKTFMKANEPKEDVTSTNQIDLPLGILPGMRPPRTLVVESVELQKKYQHVRYDMATWADLQGALEEKTLNIDRAIARRDDHLLKMDALASYMQEYPERTVGEACEFMRKDSL